MISQSCQIDSFRLTEKLSPYAFLTTIRQLFMSCRLLVYLALWSTEEIQRKSTESIMQQKVHKEDPIHINLDKQYFWKALEFLFWSPQNKKDEKHKYSLLIIHISSQKKKKQQTSAWRFYRKLNQLSTAENETLLVL